MRQAVKVGWAVQTAMRMTQEERGGSREIEERPTSTRAIQAHTGIPRQARGVRSPEPTDSAVEPKQPTPRLDKTARKMKMLQATRTSISFKGLPFCQDNRKVVTENAAELMHFVLPDNWIQRKRVPKMWFALCGSLRSWMLSAPDALEMEVSERVPLVCSSGLIW